jgi:DNA-binding NarL/FixJ family response regulator
MLRQEPGIQFCGAASNAREAWQLLDREQPDVVALEMALSGQSCRSTASSAAPRCPSSCCSPRATACCRPR